VLTLIIIFSHSFFTAKFDIYYTPN